MTNTLMLPVRFVLSFLLLTAAVTAVAQSKPTPIAVIGQLGWLAGQWRMEKAGRVTEEQWMNPAGGVMIGMARTVAKGRMVSYEFTQIREGPGGDLYFIAQPSGQKEAAFKILAFSGTEVVFENKEHDFPQTISYRLLPDGNMLAFIEGPGPNGAPRRIEYPYKRVGP